MKKRERAAATARTDIPDGESIASQSRSASECGSAAHGAIVPLWWWERCYCAPRHGMTALGVAMLMAKHRNYSDNTFAGWSLRALGEHLGLSERSVRRAVEAAVHAGIITVRRRARKTPIYSLHYGDGRTAPVHSHERTEPDRSRANHDRTNLGQMNGQALSPMNGQPLSDTTPSLYTHLSTTTMKGVENAKIDALKARGIAKRVAEQSARERPHVVDSWLAIPDWDAHLPHGIRNPAAFVTSCLQSGMLPPRSSAPKCSGFSDYIQALDDDLDRRLRAAEHAEERSIASPFSQPSEAGGHHAA